MTIAALSASYLLAINVGEAPYRVRPFNASRDQSNLDKICRNVYGGKDYLPNIATSLASDPDCSFMVLAHQDEDELVAVANMRRFDSPESSGFAWLEAVRTCSKRRNRGFARSLIQALINDERKRGTREVLTCTVESNTAMQKVLAKVGMRELHRLHQLDFSAAASFPGWAVGDERPPQSLLRVLDIESRVSDAARTSSWRIVTSQDELSEVLTRVRKSGGCGHLPALYQVVLPGEVVAESIRRGLVRKLESNGHAAVLALFRDEKITSLRSKWVCSIAATSADALEAALWKACSKEFLESLDGDAAFVVAIDGAVPRCSSICEALPLTSDPCIIFST